MTPNFALSLSFEGIRLLHRVSDGWDLAGEVSLESADLGADMNALLATAKTLEPDGIRTKLLLPNDQIKYIALDTTRTTLDDIRGAVDYATPVPLEELVIDFDRSGGRTQIAAVARQTLDEAENFAKQYGFEPMTFVAVAEPLTFSTEVFFGPTAYAREIHGPDVAFTRDESIAVIKSSGTLPGFMTLGAGTASLPPDPPVETEKPKIAIHRREPDPVIEPEAEIVPEPEPVVHDEEPAEPEIAADSAEPELILELTDEITPELSSDLPEDVSEEPEMTFHSAEPEPEPEEKAEPIEDNATDETPIVATEEVDDTSEPDLSDETPSQDAEPEMVFRRPTSADEEAKTDDTVAVDEPLTDVSEDAPADEPEDEPLEELIFASRSRGVEITRARRVPDAPAQTEITDDDTPAVDVEPDAEAVPDPIAMFTRRVPPKETSADATVIAEPDAPAIHEAMKLESTAIPPPPPLTAGPARHPLPSTQDENEEKTGSLTPLFGLIGRKEFKQAPKTDFAIGRTANKQTAANVGGKPKNLGLIMTAALVVVMLITAMWANSRMEGGIAGLFTSPDIVDETAALQNETPITPAPVEVAAAVPTVQAATEQPKAPQQPIVTTSAGTVLSPADAARIYAATGVWQRAPRLPENASAGTLDGLVEIAYLKTSDAIAQPGQPEINVAAPDSGILAPPNPNPVNRPAPRDENGFIIARPNGTVLPTGVWIYGRKPNIVPPVRPGTQEDVVVPIAATIPEVAPDEIPPLDVTPDVTADFVQPPNFTPEITNNINPFASAAPDVIINETAPTSDRLASAALQDSTPDLSQTTTTFEAAKALQPEVAPDIQDPINPTPDAVITLAPDEVIVPEATPDASEEDGIAVIAGSPALVPPLRPGSAPPDDSADAGDLLGNDPALATFRPSVRPEGLVPVPPPEPFADPQLAGIRPSVRPEDLVPPPVEEAIEVVEAPEDIPEEIVPAAPADISSIVASIAAAAPQSQIITPTRNAIVASPRPDPRPRNFDRVVASARELDARQQSRSAAASTAAAVVPATPTPAAPVASAPATRAGAPTTATVAQAATLANAIRLRDMNLIGVYGSPGDRRALIRLSNGRFVKVEVGSNLDGGRVTAIGDSALNFVKRGKTYSLQLPSG